MCWHLVTWGESVRVEKPSRLHHQLTRCNVLCVGRASWRREDGAGRPKMKYRVTVVDVPPDSPISRVRTV